MLKTAGQYFRRVGHLRKSKLLLLFFIVLVFINTVIISTKPSLQGKILSSVAVLKNGEVAVKKDLLDINIARAIRFQNWQTNGFDETLPNKPFTEKAHIGYVSNLDIEKLNLKKSNSDQSGKKKIFDDDAKLGDDHYKNIVTCEDLEYKNKLHYYISPENLDIDYVRIRNQLLDPNNPMSGAFRRKEEEGMTEEHIIKKRFHAFGTAAVWLESHNCYVGYTRMIYSINENRGSSYISVVVGQAFDKNWKELDGKRIPFRDTKIPKSVQKALEKLDKQIEYEDCKKFSDDSVSYESCITKTNKILLKLEKKKEEILNKYSVKYPSVMNVPFTVRDRWNGPEDPHVVLKKDKEGEEPVVIFNMATHRGRRVHAFMPHRKTDSLVDFDIEESDMRNDEKNWAPFFHRDTMESSNDSPGYIHLVYDYNPMEIVRCSLLTGHCAFVFQAETLEIDKGSTGILRGGTQYVSLPDVIPEVQGKNMWIGFAKAHVENCGCGGRFYRPVLTLLIEYNGVYHLELMAPNIDFNEEVLGWDLTNYNCGGYNVLSPSSISNWHVVGQDSETGKFEDYMTMTISEADAISKKVVIKGILDYVLGIYRKKEIKETFEISKEAGEIISHTKECIKKETKLECKRYGETHDETGHQQKKYEEEKKKHDEERKKHEEEKKKKEEEDKKKKKEEEDKKKKKEEEDKKKKKEEEEKKKQ